MSLRKVVVMSEVLLPLMMRVFLWPSMSLGSFFLISLICLMDLGLDCTSSSDMLKC